MLRQQVLEQKSIGGSPLGQGVLINRGVVAWMQTAGQALAPTMTTRSAAPAATTAVPSFVRHDLIQLMETVVLTVAEARSL
jgi:hypothetical protein